MYKVCLDPGHMKGIDAGAAANELNEEDLTLDICKRIKPLLEVNGIDVIMTRDGQSIAGVTSVSQSLQARCLIANKAQANVLVSVHINAGGGTGAETYVFAKGGQADQAAQKVQQYLVLCGLVNRGVKVNPSLYVLKNTAMPAILTECGFVDNMYDASLLKTEDFRQRLAVAHAKGICEYFGQIYQDAGVVKESRTTDKNGQVLDLLKQAVKILEG